MTTHQKEKFSEWLINNLQITSKSNVELIVSHVERYFCPSLPSGGNIVTDKQIIDAAPSCPDSTELDIAAHNWFINGAKWMQEQYAHQQPVNDGWVRVEEFDGINEGRLVTFSPAYKETDPMRYRIIDAQFLSTCKDVTHYYRPEPPKQTP